MCSPGECPNSVVGACHVPKWLELIDDAVALIKQARPFITITPPQMAALRVYEAEQEKHAPRVQSV